MPRMMAPPRAMHFRPRPPMMQHRPAMQVARPMPYGAMRPMYGAPRVMPQPRMPMYGGMNPAMRPSYRAPMHMQQPMPMQPRHHMAPPQFNQQPHAMHGGVAAPPPW